MGNILYFECYNGISGDMAVAALLDLGAEEGILDKALKSLSLNGFSTSISRVKKAGLDACDFNVVLEHPNHDHDMDYLHGTGQGANAVHLHGHHHGHRNLTDILNIISQAEMTARAKQCASDIFTILAKAEAKAHGTDLGHVHFHEVGAVDSIVDIISFAVCLDSLDISDVIIPALYEGCGTIRCQHGVLPIPVPATANIIQEHHIPLYITDDQGEFVTPTGAAIAAAIRTSGELPKPFHVLRIGLGAGKREYKRPSILRAMLLHPVANEPPLKSNDMIYKLETNIDDCSGETMGYVFDCLMEAGAKDVHYFPVFMKKNRPAYQLNVLCQEDDIPKLEQIIFTQTTTIGIRRQCMERTVLPRELKVIQTPYGQAQIKICSLGNQVRIYPEYQSVIKICQQTGRPYTEIYRKLQEIYRRQLT